MLFLTTGLPGHGKSLWTIHHVEGLRKESGRPVWYHRKAGEEKGGIDGLTLPWEPFDNPREWFKCPDGSIIVLDECQYVFPTRQQGAKVPEWAEKIAVHRHHGFDVFLVTQNAMNFDAYVRRLVGRHVHLKRSFGMDRSRVYQWEGIGNPDDYHSKKDALKSWFTFPKEVYSYYKSSEVHTVKKSVPWKPFVIAGGGSALVLGLLWFGVNTLKEGATADSVSEAAGAESGTSVWSGVVTAPGRGGAPISWSAEAWTPRVNGFAESAPVYDPVVSVQEAPRIAGCMEMRVGNVTDCRCSSQQGTQIPMDLAECRRYLREGVFNYRGEEVAYYPALEAYVPPLESSLGNSDWQAASQVKVDEGVKLGGQAD